MKKSGKEAKLNNADKQFQPKKLKHAKMKPYNRRKV